MNAILRTCFVLTLTTFAVGCGNFDPCGGKAGVCIAVHVEGTAPDLDQLSVSVDVPQQGSKLTPPTPRALQLPFDFALLLPDDTMGTINVTVDGLAANVVKYSDAKPATIVSKRAKITIVLGTAGPQIDGAVDTDLSPPDLFNPVCLTATACVAGDTCCPAGCDNTTDSDCMSVCGNGIIETGEICDDHNVVNGDACDPTCQFRNAVTTISGVPGSEGYANFAARFSQPYSMTFDGNNTFYVTDLNTAVVRKIDATSGGTTTLAGKAYNSVSAQTDGTFANARFGMLGAITFLTNQTNFLYVADTYQTQRIRELDLAAGTVSSPPALMGTVIQGLSANGGELVFVDNGTVKKWSRTTNVLTTLVTAAQINTAVAGLNCSNASYSGLANQYYVGCASRILLVSNTQTASPTIAVYAGAAGGGCDTGAATLANAKLSQALELSLDSGGKLLFTDWLCHTIRHVNGGNLEVFAGAANMSGYLNVNSSDYTTARFYNPRAVYQTNIGGTSYYVLDTGNDVIRRLDSVVGSKTFAGSPPNVYLTSVGTTKANARYGVPITGIATDGIVIFAVDGDGKLFAVNIATGDASAVLHDFAKGAQSMVRVGTTLYVALGDGTIHSIGLDGMGDAVYVGTVGSLFPPTEGVGVAAVLNPVSLATDGTDVYFYDGANVVRKIDHTTKQTSLIAGVPGTQVVADGGPGVAKFGDRAGDLVFANGALYHMDADTTMQGSDTGLLLRKIDIATKTVTTIAGHSATLGNTDGVGLVASFAGGHNLATDGRSLFVFDAGNQSQNGDRVNALSSTMRQVELATTRVTTMIGTPGEWTTYDATGTAALVNGGGPMVYDPTTHAVYFLDNREGVLRRIK